jgi:hypothetical protein
MPIRAPRARSRVTETFLNERREDHDEGRPADLGARGDGREVAEVALAHGRELAALDVVGGFDADAALAVAPGLTVDAFARLVDKSVVVARETPRGRTRYPLLETVREYAHQLLGPTRCCWLTAVRVRPSTSRVDFLFAHAPDPRLIAVVALPVTAVVVGAPLRAGRASALSAAVVR